MKWLNKLERKFGRFAIKNLMIYVIGLNAAVYFLRLIDTTGLITSKLALIPSLVLRGEVWRLITYVFIPPNTSMLWILFTLYFYYMVGTGLEHEWGSFKFNIYYLVGMLGTTIAAFITGIGMNAVFLNLSLFLAFAYIYPDYQILLFFLVPVKIKYIAWLDLAFTAYTVISAPTYEKAAAIASLVNYFLFFGKDMLTHTKTKQKVYYNRRSFNADIPRNFVMHRCVVCGITEKDDPKMDFRYCSECEGDYEYCAVHLETHEHIKAGEKTED